jgi:hypothetical protein
MKGMIIPPTTTIMLGLLPDEFAGMNPNTIGEVANVNAYTILGIYTGNGRMVSNENRWLVISGNKLYINNAAAEPLEFVDGNYIIATINYFCAGTLGI